ncbi:MAG: biotin-dependent carboxyltransferase family protein [Chitinophagaceae bacterium]|nr:biotin-dependent carboxyltransferase family protein [Chitinophagaceae bacterium]
MSLKVIKAGIMDSIQDAGRYGRQYLGVNPSGAMDKYAMQVANVLAGNDRNDAVIELHFPASVFLFTSPLMIALAGADFSASINGEPVPSNHCIVVNRNDVLQFHRPLNGARAYLAVRGGIRADEWLQSKSTNLKAAAGGYQGRCLQKDDEIFTGCLQEELSFLNKEEFRVLPWAADSKAISDSSQLLVLPGPEWDIMTEEAKHTFTTTPFITTRQSDRMGYRLLNQPLQSKERQEMISSPVCFGTIQLLPDGKLIVLVADHQTTGGYPRIAQVITAHHSRLAQLMAGDGAWFTLTDHATAEELLVKQEKHLQQLQNACTFRLEEYLHAANHKL